MKNITDPRDIRTAAVFRALNLGDMLCAVPALRALRAWLPQARIDYIGLPWSRSFFSRFRKYLDGFVEFPGCPGLPELACDIRRVPGFLHSMQERGYDLLLQMHGEGTITNPLCAMFGAAVTAGFCAEGGWFPGDGWPVLYPEDLPETERCLSLVKALGADPQGAALEFPLSADDLGELGEIQGTASLERGSYIVVHPGASVRARRWLPERFAETCDALSEGRLRVVITGSAAERETAERMRAMMRSPALNLAGKTTLGALGALVKDSLLVLCNDTAVSHIAAALGVPSVVVVTASDPGRWRPADSRLHRTVMRDMPCRPCAFSVCPIGHPCSRELEAGEVTAAARQLMDGTHAAEPETPAVPT